MPALITDSTTDNAKGMISISDVHKLINDYTNKVNLNCTDSARNPVLKHLYFDVSVDKIQDMIKKTPTTDNFIRINLTLNLPNQLNCDRTASIENYLSILICSIGSGDDPLLRVNDYILTEGFKEYTEDELLLTKCCVQGTPPR